MLSSGTGIDQLNSIYSNINNLRGNCWFCSSVNSLLLLWLQSFKYHLSPCIIFSQSKKIWPLSNVLLLYFDTTLSEKNFALSVSELKVEVMKSDIPTLESVDEITLCSHSNKTSSAVLSHGTIYLLCNTTTWEISNIWLA